jgi:CBS domain-containing protein
MNITKVKDVMEPRPEIVNPNAPLQRVCQKMKEVDCGVLPVGSGDELEGIITDRDIVVRAIAQGVDPALALVRDYMTDEVYFCKENDTITDAAKIMNEHNVGRLVVRNDNDQVTGVLSFGHALRSQVADEEATEMMCCAVGRKTA